MQGRSRVEREMAGRGADGRAAGGDQASVFAFLAEHRRELFPGSPVAGEHRYFPSAAAASPSRSVPGRAATAMSNPSRLPRDRSTASTMRLTPAASTGNGTTVSPRRGSDDRRSAPAQPRYARLHAAEPPVTRNEVCMKPGMLHVGQMPVARQHMVVVKGIGPVGMGVLGEAT